MVSPQQVDPFRVADLQDQQQRYHLDAEFPPVDVVPQKKVLLLRCTSESLEDVGEVEVLSMDIADDCERCVES